MITTRLLQVDARDPQRAAIADAADVIRAGGTVAFPTETVYGLGANALDPAAVAAIFIAKGRPNTNPLIVHLPDVDGARTIVARWPDAADRLVERFWPGPLTLVLPKRPLVPASVTAGLETVAVRVPAHPVARALLLAADRPIAAPSANRSTRVSATTAAHVLRQLDGRIDLVLDGGSSWAGLESTVLDLASSPPRVLRPGPITADELAQCLGLPKVEVVRTAHGDDVALPSPGMMARHYAPHVPLVCVPLKAVSREIVAARDRIGWVHLSGDDDVPDWASGATVLMLPDEPRGYAAGLYAALHTLEDAGVERIIVTSPPDGVEWTAIHDRLRRAATPQ